MPPVGPRLRRLFEWPDADAPLGPSAQTAIRTILELPGLPAEEQYRLWLQHDDNRVLQALLDHPDIRTDPQLVAIAKDACEEEGRHILQTEICSSERFWLLANLARPALPGVSRLGGGLRSGSDSSPISHAFEKLHTWIEAQSDATLIEVLGAVPRPEIAHAVARHASPITGPIFHALTTHHAALLALVSRVRPESPAADVVYERTFASLATPKAWCNLPPLLDLAEPHRILDMLAARLADLRLRSDPDGPLLDHPILLFPTIGEDLARAVALIPELDEEARTVHGVVLWFAASLPPDDARMVMGSYSALARPAEFERLVEVARTSTPKLFMLPFEVAPDALIDALDQSTLAAWLSHADPEFRRATLLHILPRTRLHHDEPGPAVPNAPAGPRP